MKTVKTVKTESFSMDYFQFGHGKETLVILPGLSVQSVMDFADAVAEAYGIFDGEYTVYVLDRRKELPASYSLQEMARDTAAAIRALGLKRVNLFGASQGGMIAMEIAIHQPELVQKLALGSTAASIPEARYRTVENWIQLAKAGEKRELYLSFGQAIYPQEVFAQSRELLAQAAGSVTGEDLRRFVILAESLRGFDISSDLSKIACPVLVIGSEDDRVLGADAARQIAEGLNRQNSIVLFMYDGYGHAAYDTAPDYKARILSFLKSETTEARR
ncbi:MAG: alpha/beta hydrolase [Firmicutes bacterium]|nr:alpha/beta hydrolase [Bacillota bacterium]